MRSQLVPLDLGGEHAVVRRAASLQLVDVGIVVARRHAPARRQDAQRLVADVFGRQAQVRIDHLAAQQVRAGARRAADHEATVRRVRAPRAVPFGAVDLVVMHAPVVHGRRFHACLAARSLCDRRARRQAEQSICDNRPSLGHTDERRARPMPALLHFVALTAPLFALIALGFGLARTGRWPAAATDALTRFVPFSVAIPAFLFRLMSDFSTLPPVDARVLLAYFGGCLVVFAIGRAVSRAAFRHDGVAQSVFALGGIFSNNVLLGVPLVQVTLGETAMPVVSLVVVFNTLTLWTLVSVSVNGRHSTLSAARSPRPQRASSRTRSSQHPRRHVVRVHRARASQLGGPRAARCSPEPRSPDRAGHGLSTAVRGLARERRDRGDQTLVQPAVVWSIALIAGLPPETRSCCWQRCRSAQTILPDGAVHARGPVAQPRAVDRARAVRRLARDPAAPARDGHERSNPSASRPDPAAASAPSGRWRAASRQRPAPRGRSRVLSPW
jgi:hypothetical protein